MTLTNFPNGISSFGVPVLGSIGGIPFTGNYWFVDPASGADGNDGSADLPLATLYEAYHRCVDGNNDVVILVGNGQTSGTARLSTALASANAVAHGSTADNGALIWAKNATHLIGVCAPTTIGQRARIAPPSGTYTATTFNATTFVSVTASGCMFANIDVFCGFSTGNAAMIAWADSGARNAYINVNIQGLGDAASAGGANARVLKISGGGEHLFEGCTLGVDTVTRSAANATVEFSGGTARTVFRNCIFPFMTSAATPLGVIVSAAAGSDRFQLFDSCTFINAVQSTSTTMAGLSTLAASMGGMHVYKNCTLVGITEFGTDATSRGQIYVDGAAPTAATSGIAVNPT
jgi:hypothetical protein